MLGTLRRTSLREPPTEERPRTRDSTQDAVGRTLTRNAHCTHYCQLYASRLPSASVSIPPPRTGTAIPHWHPDGIRIASKRLAGERKDPHLNSRLRSSEPVRCRTPMQTPRDTHFHQRTLAAGRRPAEPGPGLGATASAKTATRPSHRARRRTDSGRAGCGSSRRDAPGSGSSWAPYGGAD